MEYALAHPYLTAILLAVFIRSATVLLHWPFRLATYYLRHRSIMLHGWPPDHLDADGDVVRKEEARVPAARPTSV